MSKGHSQARRLRYTAARSALTFIRPIALLRAGAYYGAVELQTPDTYHLSAAIGWLELGNPTEAKAELSKIAVEFADHPDVLEVQWQICATEKDWPNALEAARALVQCDPNRSSGWLHQAYALRRVPSGGTAAAMEALLPAVEAFPSDPIIPYNLACYACQLEQLSEAESWLREAMNRSNKKAIKKMALDDPDLEPLQKEIRRL